MVGRTAAGASATVLVCLSLAGCTAGSSGGGAVAPTEAPLVFESHAPAKTPATAFGEGSYVVGQDIEPGRYSGGTDAEVIADCRWQQNDAEGARLDGSGADRPTQVLTLRTDGSQLVVAGAKCEFVRLPD